MKIIQANKFFYERRGAERVMFMQIDGLEKRGHQVFPFATKYPKNIETPYSQFFAPALDTEQLNITQIPKYLLRATWSPAASNQLRKLIEYTQAQIFHAHNIYTHLSPSVLYTAKKSHLKTIVHLHDYGLVSANYALWGGDQPLDVNNLKFIDIAKSKYIKNSFLATSILEIIHRLQRQLKLYDKYTDQFIAVSEAVKKVMIQLGYPEEKIIVLPNPILSKSKQGGGFASRSGVLFFGQLDSSKGIETAITATARLGQTLYVAGSGPALGLLQKFKHIKYLGYLNQQELQIQMSHVKCAVFPSKWLEPYSMASLEALSAGLPIIVSKLGGFPEMVQSGKLGIICNPQDIDEWTKSIDELVNNQRTWEVYREHILMSHQTLLNEESYIDELVNIYKNLPSVDK